VYERASDTDRPRVTDHPLSRVVSSPQPRIGAYRFWETVISDGLLYDRWAVLKRLQGDGSMVLSRIPAWRLRLMTNVFLEVEAARMWTGDEWVDLNLADLIFDHGYAPKTAGLSPVETLRDLLDETAEAVQYRREVWANGARAPQYITRPQGAAWSSTESRERFVKGMREYVKDGAKAGGIPLLEDGMKLEDGTRIPSKDMLDLDGRQLSAVETASAWHIAPELIGAREGNYSNVDAYRQMLYRESLGPYITAWEQAINACLTPDLAEGRPLYVEANLDSKLRGSFLEQAAVLTSATGRPYMVTDEARARMNLPALGGDAGELVTPLNVLVGGQTSPRDSGSQNLSAGPRRTVKGAASEFEIKAPEEVPEDYQKAMARVFSEFFARQRKVVLSRLGAKAPGWWDQERWDKELAADLLAESLDVTKAAALAAIDAMGEDPSAYSVERTKAFLAKVAERIAGQVNGTTLSALEDSVDDEEADPAHVFDVAEESRATKSGWTAAATYVGFAMVEAARQTRPKARKRWQVNSGNPRSSHAALNGEEVDIDEDFSNGLPWPGSFNGDPDEVANCQCSVVIIT
jgi:HK97 family phage portal protein